MQTWHNQCVGVTAAKSTAVADEFARRVMEWEEANLSPLAARSYPAHREREEDDCGLRTPFQRDRDRIVHSKSFRRLKHKTQVFIAPAGDHYRTRLTHTLEACGISRTVARALRLNEDLTEAIGLGHDLGHTPFGHKGEEILNALALERFGRRFKHNEHSLRLVTHVERGGCGLNLTREVRDGILNHTGDDKPRTLEGRIVKLVDRVAYINHDIDDALRAGALMTGDLPSREIEILGDTGSRRIDTLVHDLVEHSRAAGDIVQSESVGRAMLSLREFMFERIYLGGASQAEHGRIEKAMRTLFDYYCEHPDALPSAAPDTPLGDRVIDYVAGMTDRFAIHTFESLTVPREFAE